MKTIAKTETKHKGADPLTVTRKESAKWRRAAPERAYLRRADIAHRTGLSLSTIDRAIALGRMMRGRVGLWPQFKMGRSLIVPVAAVDKWIRREGAIVPGMMNAIDGGM